MTFPVIYIYDCYKLNWYMIEHSFKVFPRENIAVDDEVHSQAGDPAFQ